MRMALTVKCEGIGIGGVFADVNGGGFPSFLPKEVEKFKDPFARTMARKIQRLPITLSETRIMSSCIEPVIRSEKNPVVLLHCFDSSCLEWSYAYPLLEEAGLETWAVDVLGWGFSDLGGFVHEYFSLFIWLYVLPANFFYINYKNIFNTLFSRLFLCTLDSLPPCNVQSKRSHLYQFWKSYIKRSMVLVGPSLGAAVALDFAANHPEAVEKLVLINACVYSNCTGHPTNLPKAVAYAGVSLLKSFPLRLFANKLAFNGLSLAQNLEWTKVGRLHCLLPWWEDATVNFMNSGGYNVISQIKEVKHRALVISGEDDKIIRYKDTVRLYCELPNAIMRVISESGHLPHVDSPVSVSKLITDFILRDSC